VARQFLTVADELLEHAECVANFLEGRGYSVKIEQFEIGYPYTPTLRCRRAPTTLFVDVYGVVMLDRVTAWTRWAKSRNRDTRIALALPQDAPRRSEDDAILRDMGVGLYLSDGATTQEAMAAKDMALNVELPELSTLPLKMRRVLGPVYDQFDHSQWREGFEDACQAVEVLSRKYLSEGVASGRIVLVTRAGKTRHLSSRAIDKLTMGQLAKPTTEARLRRNVGQHMWTVVAILKELLGPE
jgi:hypothetical protein